jgi:hypothetical protein
MAFPFGVRGLTHYKVIKNIGKNPAPLNCDFISESADINSIATVGISLRKICVAGAADFLALDELRRQRL